MSQKIQFIVTVLHRPKLLIFDDPFSGFDPINADRIKDEILALKENGTSIIFSTHRMESVEELCEYIALLHKSEKILDGKLWDIKKAYKNNSYNVGVKLFSEPNGILDELNEKFKISDAGYDSQELQFNFTMHLPDENTAAALDLLQTKGNINHFKEVIPSANDIFIQTVKAKTQ